MSFNTLAKSAVCTFMLSSLLCACSELSLERPNHSWFADKSYGTEGQNDADLATVAYSQGNFAEAENYVIQALAVNPKNTQALMVGALVYEKLGRLNRARQYYEDIIIIGGDEMTILGTEGSAPEKMTEVARKRLRLLNMQITDFMIENHNGTMTFNISKEAAERQGKSAMEEALFVRTQRFIANNQADSQADIKAVEVLFDEGEKNIVSRFLIMNELAENDMITKQEFLEARAANIGGLLPLSNMPPALGIDAPVPSPDLIIERINSLKEAVEARAITPQEFSAERDLIIKAILPPKPRQRMKPKAPAKDILSAAKDLRKVEVISELGLITDKEKSAEKAAIEKSLGIAHSETAPQNTVVSTAKPDVKEDTKPETKEATPVQSKDTSAPVAENIETVEDVQILIPEVLSPFAE